MTNESTETTALRKMLLKQGWYFIKIVQQGYTERGIPDILGCIDGYFIGIEVKIKRGNRILYSDHQKMHLNNIRIAGGIGIGVVYDFAQPDKMRWALDIKTTGETDHLEWISLASLAEGVRSLPVTMGLTDQLPVPRSRQGQKRVF